MTRNGLLFVVRTGACLAAVSGACLGQSRDSGTGRDGYMVPPITHPRLPGDPPSRGGGGGSVGGERDARAARSAGGAPSDESLRFRVSTPGTLRRITTLRPVGGDIRPVGGDFRPVGGDIGITGGGLRPVEPVSPLQNDRSFAARLEPHTPRFGVIGHAVVPGWDDPPWTSGRSGGPPRVQPVEAGASSGRAAARESVWRRYAPPVRTASQAGPGPVGEADRTRAPAPASAADESDWVDPRPIPSVSARPRQDVRPDIRLAARLASEGRTRGAVDTLRQAVYRDAEAFCGAGGPLVTDADTLALLRQTIAAYREGGHTGVSAADAAFMAAAMEAASGDGDAAFEAMRTARQAGEDRPSGKALHRVLSRGRVSSESQPASGVQP